MDNVFNEKKVENNVESSGACTYCGHNPREVAKRIEKSVEDAKAAFTEKLEDGRIAAQRLVRRGRFAVEDGISQTARNIKRNPYGSIALAFAAGAALALLFPRPAKRN